MEWRALSLETVTPPAPSRRGVLGWGAACFTALPVYFQQRVWLVPALVLDNHTITHTKSWSFLEGVSYRRVVVHLAQQRQLDASR